MNKDQLDKLNQFVEKSQTVLVIVTPDADFDQLAAAVSLYKSLQIKDKDISLISSQKFNYDEQLISGMDDLRTKLGNKNLVISFDYEENTVDKVSYNIGEETKKFYLTIKPKKNHKPLDSENVEFYYSGADADLIFLFGVNNLEDLKDLYYGFENLYNQAQLVVINNLLPRYGDIKISTSQHSSTCEAIAKIIEELKLNSNNKIANNLLAGIEVKTQSFSSPLVNAKTFEAVSNLMKAGGKRLDKIRLKRLIEAEKLDKNTNTVSAKKSFTVKKSQIVKKPKNPGFKRMTSKSKK